MLEGLEQRMLLAAPELVTPIGAQAAVEDAAFTFTVPENTFADADGNETLTYSAAQSDESPLPAWLTFNAATQTFSGTPTNDDVGSLNIKVTVADDTLPEPERASAEFTLTVTNTNDDPTVANPIPDQVVTEGQPFTFIIPADSFADIDANDTRNFSAKQEDGSDLPAWLQFDPVTGTFSSDSVGSANVAVNVTAIDSGNATASDTFNITINHAPTVANTLADQSATEDQAFTYQVPVDAFTDADAGDSLTYEAALENGGALPGWLTFDAVTRTFSGTPANADVGTLNIKVTATDSADVSASDVFTLTTANVNDAPALKNAIGPQDATEDTPYSFTIPANTFEDVDLVVNPNEALTYAAAQVDDSPLPEWLQFDPTTGTFTANPTNNEVGTVDIKVTVTDKDGKSASDTFTLTVAETNDDPTVAKPINDNTTVEARTATEDAPFLFEIPADTFADADGGDSLTYTATLEDGSALPAWLVFNPADALFLGIPADPAVGTLSIKVTATDTGDKSASDIFTLTVTNTNDAPIATDTIADQLALEEDLYTFTFDASLFEDVDADSGDTLTYSAVLDDGTPNGAALPAWLSFDPATRTFSGTAQDADVAPYFIKVFATDSANASAFIVFKMTVSPVDDDPVLNTPIADQSVEAGEIFSYAFPADTFTDEDTGDFLTYTATLEDGSELPAWLLFDSGIRKFTGMPTNEHVGTYNIKVTAKDSTDAAMSDVFTLTVRTNSVPTVANAIADQSATEDQAFTYQVPEDTFADADNGDLLTYTATLEDGSALPGWLSFNAATRTFSGTPLNANTGTVNIKVTATDQLNASVSDTFALAVAAVNDTPTVANAIPNQTATEETEFTFSFAANTFADEEDAQALTYTATLADGSALPAWLSFDAATRTFSGTAPANFAGTVSIKVNATDTGNGTGSATFDLNVQNVNDDPTAANDTYSATVGTQLVVPAATGVLANDDDQDAADTLTATLVNQAINGTVTLNADGSFTYTPNASFVGKDVFTYSVTDGTTTKNATVEINVAQPANTLPVASSMVVTRRPGTAALVNVLEDVTNTDNDPLHISIFTQPAHGRAFVNNNGTPDLADDYVEYLPNLDYFGNDSFKYTISDGRGGMSTATINVATAGIGLVSNPFNPKRKDLVVVGTSKNDKIQLVKSGSKVKVMINGKSKGAFAPTGRIVVDGLAGNDVITAKGLGRTVWLYGGAGKDSLTGSTSRDRIFDGSSEDVIS